VQGLVKAEPVYPVAEPGFIERLRKRLRFDASIERFGSISGPTKF